MRLLLLLLYGFLCAPVLAQDPLPSSVGNALKAAGISPAAVGIVVRDAATGDTRLAVNAGQPMNPASLMKLVTTFAGLELLGPAYTWKTTVWSAAPIEDGVLKGDLVIRGSADPKLTFEQFWLLLRQLRGRGIRDIAGDLVLDRSLLAVNDHDSPTFDDKPLRPYNAGADAQRDGGHRGCVPVESIQRR